MYIVAQCFEVARFADRCIGLQPLVKNGLSIYYTQLWQWILQWSVTHTQLNTHEYTAMSIENLSRAIIATIQPWSATCHNALQIGTLSAKSNSI